MKIIAFYLPQFHEVEENNKWWGDGFTEWTNVKSAKPLSKKHNQPLIPLQENYYNLLDKDTVKWQADLAEKYNVYGFCYYHYWFSGRKILEKPAENLLEWNDINKKFCFCWANHTWKKTWNGSMEILIDQTYGDEKEWELHFEYLKNFFVDDRYIKKNNKPILMIYNSKEIPNIDERIKYYDERCVEIGFEGIYIIESINNQTEEPVSKYSEGILLREPSIALTTNSPFKKVIRKLANLNIKDNIRTYEYKSIYYESLKYAANIKCKKRIFLGSFAGWDSTPRHGLNGYIIDGFSKVKFYEYLNQQNFIINNNNMDEMVFFNAWNEWAEGMFLEPDTYSKYERLEVIKEVVGRT